MNTILLILTCIGTIAVDQLSKLWALRTLHTESIVVTSWWNFDLSWNKGVSWSLLTPNSEVGTWLLTGLITLFILALMYACYQHIKQKTAHIFEALLLGGALSNLTDRITHGAVLDFIQWHWHDWYWPTFNVADAAIVCGVCGILFVTWWKEQA